MLVGWRCGRHIWGIGEIDTELLLDESDERAGDEVDVNSFSDDADDAQLALATRYRLNGVGVVVQIHVLESDGEFGVGASSSVREGGIFGCGVGAVGAKL